MFYRSIALVLAVTMVLAIRLSDSPAIAFATQQDAKANPESSSAADDIVLNPEAVVVSVPTPGDEESSAIPDFSALRSNHLMLLEHTSIGPVIVHTPTTNVSAPLPVDAEPTPALAAPVASSVAAQPVYNAAPAYNPAPVYNAAPAYSTPPTSYAPVSEYPAATYYENQYVGVQAPIQHAPVQHVHNATYHSGYAAYQPTPASAYHTEVPSHPALNTDNYGLFQYRRLMKSHSAPHPQELQGTWQGINKGIATVAIDERFIKEFRNVNGQVYGDNIEVNQNSGDWAPIRDQRTGDIKRQGKFLVQQPRGIGPFRHGVVLNYSKGGNRKLDPANLISDQLVKLDDNHMLGRATAKFGPIRIPLAYFVLQRVPE